MSAKVTDVQVRIGAMVGGFDAGMKSAAASARVFERELAKLEDAQRKMAQAEAAAYREDASRKGARIQAQRQMAAMEAAAYREESDRRSKKTQAERSMAQAEAAAYREGASRTAQQESAQRRLAAAEAAAYREEVAHAQKRAEAQEKVGKAFLASSAAIALGIGLASKAAIDWQADFAQVEKTLPSDTSQGAFGVLDKQLRGLSTRIPVSAGDLAGLAASASQLGVGQQDLARFTATAASLGEVTTLSAEDAVTGLAKLGNVMEPGKFASNIERAGSALLALGNEGASTEGEILDMAQRIAGAGKTVGLTEPQVLSFANALTSVGLEAEGGGTAISRVMVDMAQAVNEGGESLDNFARVSGVSAAQFKQEFETNAAGAVARFIGGLGQIKARGGDVFGTLSAMNLSEIRVRDTLLRASSASDLLTRSLTTGQKAWDESTALSDAAGKRYETAAAKIQIARNRLQDTAITIGGAFLPAVAGVADKAGALIEVFQGLPGPAKQALGVIGTLGVVAGGLGGTALMLVPKLHNFVSVLDEMGPKGARAASAVRTMGSALAGPWGIALAIGTVALGEWANKQAEAKQRVDSLTESVKADGNAIGENTKKMVAQQLAQEGVLAATRQLGLSQSDVLEATLGNVDAQGRLNAALEKAKSGLGQGSQSLTDLMGLGSADSTVSAIQRVENAVGSSSSEMKQAVTNAKDEAAALQGVAGASGQAASGMSGVAQEAIDTKTEAKKAKEALDELKHALDGLAETELGMEAANDAVLRDLKSVENAAKGGGTKGAGKVSAEDRARASDAGKLAKAEAIAAGKTKAEAIAAGKQARESVLAAARKSSTGTREAADPLEVRAAMRTLVDDELKIIEKMADHGASADQLKAKSAQLAKQVYDEGRKIGLTREQAEHYAAALKEVPDVVSTLVKTDGLDEAISKVRTLGDNLTIVAGKGAIPITVGGDTRPYSTPPSQRAAGPVVASAAGKGTPVAGAPVAPSRAAAKRYAAGGVERHDAQIGVNRIWGEPETGGEAYIPLSPAKRARSTALLSDVARGFGMNVTRGTSSSGVQVVRVPVQQTSNTTHPVNVNGPITVVANSPAQFTDWSRSQHGFGAAKVG